MLLSKKVKRVNTKQIFFDFLGELVKFNKFNLNVLLLLLKERGLEHKLFELINSNHIDSNVLTRSIVLTSKRISLEKNYEIFLHEKSSLDFIPQGNCDNFENEMILQEMNSYGEQTAKNYLIKSVVDCIEDVLIKLLESVTMENLSSESKLYYLLNQIFVV